MNLPPYVFDVDHFAKIRSELSITVLGKKLHKNDITRTDHENQIYGLFREKGQNLPLPKSDPIFS